MNKIIDIMHNTKKENHIFSDSLISYTIRIIFEYFIKVFKILHITSKEY